MGSLTTTSPPSNIPLPTSLSLLNRTALATGGTRGISKGIALELARRGASIAIVYANPKNIDRARETVAEIEALGTGALGKGASGLGKGEGNGVKAVTVLADLKDPEVGERIVRETLEGLGGKGDTYFG
jgi:3-oxoacyl-[acyl-carrier protein] reductase